MKTMKQVAAMLLALCMLVGMPMAVGAADDAPLTIVKAEPYDGNMLMTSTRLAVKLSEEISSVASSGLRAFIGIYKGNTDGQYRYKWDATTSTCTEVAPTGSTADGWSLTAWQLGSPRHADGGVGYCNNGQTGFFGNIANSDTFGKILAIYHKILEQDSNVRLVVSIQDSTSGVDDGYIDLLKSADG